MQRASAGAHQWVLSSKNIKTYLFKYKHMRSCRFAHAALSYTRNRRENQLCTEVSGTPFLGPARTLGVQETGCERGLRGKIVRLEVGEGGGVEGWS